MAVFCFWAWCLFSRLRQAQIWAECEPLFEHLLSLGYELEPRTLRPNWVFKRTDDGVSCRVVFQAMLSGHRLVIYATDKHTVQTRITQPKVFDSMMSKIIA